MDFSKKRVYNKTTLDTLTNISCAQCGAKLILLDTVTEKLDGTLFPQTTSTYRCTDSECQELRDKELDKRLKMRAERAVAEEKRIEERKSKRVSKVRLP